MSALGWVWLTESCPRCDLPLAASQRGHPPVLAEDGRTVYVPITVHVVCCCGWTLDTTIRG